MFIVRDHRFLFFFGGGGLQKAPCWLVDIWRGEKIKRIQEWQFPKATDRNLNPHMPKNRLTGTRKKRFFIQQWPLNARVSVRKSSMQTITPHEAPKYDVFYL